MKRIFAIFLVISTLLALAACGADAPADVTTTAPTTQPVTQPITEPTTQPTTMANDKFTIEQCADLIGTWQYDLVLSGELLHLSEMEGQWVIPVTYVFLDNGECMISTGLFDDTLAAFEEAVENYMFESYHEQFIGDCKLQGMSNSKIDKAWQTQQEVAREDAKTFVQNLSLSPRIAQLDRDGDYYVEEGKVYVSRADGSYEACGFALGEDGVLTLTDTDNLNLYRPLGIRFPLALNPVNLIEPRG